MTKRTQVYEIIMEVTSNDDQSVAGCSIDGSGALITAVLLDMTCFLFFPFWGKDLFTVVCLVTWPFNESKAVGDLVMIETSWLFFVCKLLLISVRTASLT